MRYARNPEVLWRSTSLGPVVLLGDREPVRLGGAAAAVWEALDDALDLPELEHVVGTLVDDRPDVTLAVTGLVEAGLVVGPAAPGPGG